MKMYSVDSYDRLNPDRDFVLHGNSPPLGERNGFFTNSQNTTTTLNLCQTAGYNPKNYAEELVRSSDYGISRERSLSRMQDPLPSFGGRPKSAADCSWFTNPVHLSQEYDHYPLFRSMGVPARDIASVSRPVGFTGAALAAEKPRKYTLRTGKEMEDYVLSHLNKTEIQHFPVTMSASKLIDANTPLVRPTAILHQKGISQKLAPRRSRSPTRSKSATSRSRSLQRDTFDADQDLEKLYLMTAEAPVTGSAGVYTTSPYQQELSRLRMEQLRLEEEQLLELKRQVELERIRGPKPKWYEMKTPEFHYEARKNTEMLKSKNDWNDLIRYRSDLTQASKDFQMSLGEVI